MNVSIDYATALARHPALVAEIMNKLAKGKSKSKGTPADQMEWSYYWAVGLGPGASSDVLENCYVALEAKAGAWKGGVGLPNANSGPTAKADVPPEIVALYNAPKPIVTPETVPHVCRFEAIEPRGPVTALAVGGYRTKNRTNILYTVVGANIEKSPTLMCLENSRAEWGGILHYKAEEAYKRTPEGGTFSYRNLKMTRMTAQEIRDTVEGKSFRISVLGIF